MVSKLFKKLRLFFFEKQNDSFIKKLKAQIQEFKIVFDIGAYHGKFIDDILQKNPGVVIHGFEPYTKSYEFLCNKYQNNKNVIVNNFAVSDKPGLATFNINAFAETNSLLESASVNETINSLTKKKSAQDVEVVRIGDYCLQNNIENIDLVKIDTQGNSFNVLAGMEQLLKNKKVKYLYVEAEFIEIYKSEKLFAEIEILMRSFDYSIVDLYNLNYVNNEKLAWCDVLFTPNK
jgi:FkbM family methyltransferase